MSKEHAPITPKTKRTIPKPPEIFETVRLNFIPIFKAPQKDIIDVTNQKEVLESLEGIFHLHLTKKLTMIGLEM